MKINSLDPLIHIKPGLYRHYKGNSYRVYAAVRHSETLQSMTIYQQLYGDFAFWVRPSSMFEEYVDCEGERVPRFLRLSD